MQKDRRGGAGIGGLTPAREVAGGIPGARFEFVTGDGSSHVVPLERPDDFLQLGDERPGRVTSPAGRQPSNHRSQSGESMPPVQVKLIEGVFDADEKEAIIEKLTDAIVSVEGGRQ
jgi:hypothetical protein